MREILSTITSKGQITLPKDVRERLGVGEHDRVAFVLEDDGTIRLTKPTYPTVASLAGAAGSLGRAVSWEQMREEARDEHLARKFPPLQLDQPETAQPKTPKQP